jgi:hypothetical protein
VLPNSISIPPSPLWLVNAFVLVSYALLGLVVFLVVSFFANDWITQKRQRKKRWDKVAACFAIVCITLSAVSIGGLIAVIAYPPAPSPIVEISAPQDNSTVEYVVNVKGASQNVLNDQQLWLLVWSHTQQYWPQPPLQRSNDGNWSGLVYLGEPNVITNGTYYISAVLADKNANETFNNAFKMNVPIKQIPQGAKEYDTVAVRRIR